MCFPLPSLFLSYSQLWLRFYSQNSRLLKKISEPLSTLDLLICQRLIDAHRRDPAADRNTILPGLTVTAILWRPGREVAATHINLLNLDLRSIVENPNEIPDLPP